MAALPLVKKTKQCFHSDQLSEALVTLETRALIQVALLYLECLLPAVPALPAVLAVPAPPVAAAMAAAHTAGAGWG